MGSLRTYLFKSADALAGPLLCDFIGRRRSRKALYPKPTAGIPLGSPASLLVIRPGGIGDMILLLPVLRDLENAFPGANIDVICEKRNRPVLDLAGWTGNLLVYDSNPTRFLAQLHRQNYDAAIDTEQFHHFSAVFAAISGAPVRIGFKINPRRNSLYTHLVNYAPDGHEGAQFYRLLEPLGITNHSHDLDGLLHDVNLQLGTRFENKLAQSFGNRPFAVVHVGATSRYKRWPPRRFSELLRQLEKHHGMGGVLVGNRSDQVLSEEVAARVKEAGGTVLMAAGHLDLARSAGLIRKAKLFIGVDSGLGHLAVALGTPSIMLFGSSDPLKWGFESPTHRVVKKELACAPCAMFGYHKPCRHIACMEQIGVPDVMAACNQVLGALNLYQPQLL